MLAGAIPVTFAKNVVSVLPFPDLIDWGQLVVTLNDSAVTLGDLLTSLKVRTFAAAAAAMGSSCLMPHCEQAPWLPLPYPTRF